MKFKILAVQAAIFESASGARHPIGSIKLVLLWKNGIKRCCFGFVHLREAQHRYAAEPQA